MADTSTTEALTDAQFMDLGREHAECPRWPSDWINYGRKVARAALAQQAATPAVPTEAYKGHPNAFVPADVQIEVLRWPTLGKRGKSPQQPPVAQAPDEVVLPPFEDARVQAAYSVLCDDKAPPAGEHWEGYAARRIVAALAQQAATPAVPPEPAKLPLFASSVARRKWEVVQAQGHRMQHIYFERDDGSRGTIDAWGAVTWATATPQHPAAQAPDAALQLAIRFHETYERLAPQFGYETRADTKTFDPESKNGRLMVAVCTALSQAVPQSGGLSDAECVCKGNWRLILKGSEHLIGKRLRDSRTGKEWTYFGLVHGEDDYYYGMWSKPELHLLSCVGNLDSYGLETIDAARAGAVEGGR